MLESTALETLFRQHVERNATYADLFKRVAPEAMAEHDATINKRIKRSSAGRGHWQEDEMLFLPPLKIEEDDAVYKQRIERIRQRFENRAQIRDIPAILMESRIAKAITLQPVRDTNIDGIIVLPEDRQLDVIGPPYPKFWISKSGNVLPALQTVWANPADGAFGFDHEVTGTVTGRQANSGAGLCVRFVPRIAPGIAQIRPFAPLLYQWTNLSFKSREDNSATLGIRVWSWDMGGGDFVTERDYTYYIWNNTTYADHFATASSPSWVDPNADPFNPGHGDHSPGWDDEYGFLFGKEAPYFKTRQNRIYMAAIWCYGVCWSVSPKNHPGLSIGRLRAQIPWVVIGYQ